MNLEVMKHFLKARNFQRISDTADEYRFTIYRTLKTSRVQLQKFSKSTNSKVCIRMKFTFVLAPCQIDEHSGHIITRMDVSYYEWESSLQSNYSVRNAALIHKAIRLLSLGCTEVADHELMIIFVLPFFTNLPFAYRSPAAVKDNSFVTNIYFDEFLAVFIINNTLTLSGFRLSPIPLIERKPEDPSMYSKYAGSISGLAKIPDLVNNYYQLNQLDLSVIPQDIIKYRLITSGHSKDNPITKMTNVQSLQYYLRREILGLGTCDIKVEIYLSHDVGSAKQSGNPGDIDINAANIELFYVAIAARIINALKFELAKTGQMRETKDMKEHYVDLRPKFKGKASTIFPQTSYASPDAYHPDRRPSSSNEGSAPPQVSNNVLSSTFLKASLISKIKGIRKSSFMGRKENSSTKLFRDRETVMFLVKIMPSLSKVAKHKIILSSADIVNIFNITEFLIESLGRSKLDLEAIRTKTR
jgi:hypothetical protein